MKTVVFAAGWCVDSIVVIGLEEYRFDVGHTHAAIALLESKMREVVFEDKVAFTLLMRANERLKNESFAYFKGK